MSFLNKLVKLIGRRFIAYVIDWYIGGIFINIPIVLIYGCVFNQTQMQTNLLEISKESLLVAYLAGIAGVVFGIFYFFIVPFFIWPGQTLGKRILKIKIINNNGQDISFFSLFLRQIIGLTVLEGVIISLTGTIRQLFDLLFHTSIFTSSNLMIFAYALSFISCLFVLIKGRALHDFIASTRIEYLKSS